MTLKGRTEQAVNRIAPTNLNVNRSNMDRRPKFSLKYLTKKFSLDKCSKEEKAAFADKLHEMSQQVWSQIFQGARHSNGFEKLGKGKDLAWIQDIFKDKNIIAFRFAGLKAMIGFIDNEILYIPGLDRNFTAYKH